MSAMPIADRARQTLFTLMATGVVGLFAGGALLALEQPMPGLALIAAAQIALLIGIIGMGVRYGVAASGAFDLFVAEDADD